jgi:hypothetical protein
VIPNSLLLIPVKRIDMRRLLCPARCGVSIGSLPDIDRNIRFVSLMTFGTNVSVARAVAEIRTEAHSTARQAQAAVPSWMALAAKPAALDAAALHGRG